MQATVTNGGYITWIGFNCTGQTFYLGHPITKHQCKKVCYSLAEVEQLQRNLKTPSHLLYNYVVLENTTQTA